MASIGGKEKGREGACLHDEKETGEAPDGNAEGDGIGKLHGRIVNFLSHRGDHTERGEPKRVPSSVSELHQSTLNSLMRSFIHSRIRRWQHANEERKAAPARERSIISPQRLPRRMPTHSRLGRQTNQRDEDAYRREGRANRIHHGQDAVAKRDNGKCDGANGVEDQQQLPRGRGPVRVVQRNRGGDQRGETEVDGEGNGPVAEEPGPARDEGQHGAVARVGELERPVIGPCRGGIARSKLAQGEGDALVYDEDDDPA